ncbi:MAG: adenylate/guanylate cyclase domain-containing protein [Acidobacteria bacterium]|nr:adenylate/guanylate cyclase domain-containing protein [Acidobacteriota bacterium]
MFEHSVVLDKFIGDGVMALFVPQNHGDEGKEDAKNAVCAAVKMDDEFNKLRCSMHTGEALAGNVGTDFRHQFTALGPHVNLAARIERSANSGQILCFTDDRSPGPGLLVMKHEMGQN